jgi:hypothetical protein
MGGHCEARTTNDTTAKQYLKQAFRSEEAIDRKLEAVSTKSMVSHAEET